MRGVSAARNVHDRRTVPLAGGDHQSPRVHRGPARAGPPVVALSAEPGILLLTVKTSTPKLFEIYDHLALGSLGHPADIEKVRQAAIDAAHLEGFAALAERRHRAPARQLQPRARAEERLRADFLRAAALPRHPRRARRDAGGRRALALRLRRLVQLAKRRRSCARPRHQRPAPGGQGLAGSKARPGPRARRSRPPALSALKLLVWAKLRGTKDQGIEFGAMPGDLAALKEKLKATRWNSRCSTARCSTSRSCTASRPRTSWGCKFSPSAACQIIPWSP